MVPSRTIRRLLVPLLAAATAIGLAVLSPTAAGAVPFGRVAGPDRYATAAQLSRSQFAAGVPVAFVVTGADFPDALAAGPAAAGRGGPVLLTERDRVPTTTAEELTRLKPNRIVVAGGRGVVSDAVLTDLDRYDAGGGVIRVAGNSRFETAAAVSADSFANATTVYVANGFGFADALAGAPAANREKAPLLLVDAGSVPAATTDEIKRLGARRVVVLGGEGVVGKGVADQLRASGLEVVRLAGPDREGTSAAISAAAFSPGVGVAYLVTGRAFADGLAAGPVAALQGGPILLATVNCITRAVEDELNRLNPQRLVLVGGTGAVGPGVEDRSVCPSPNAPVRRPTVQPVSTPAWNDDGPDPQLIRLNGAWWAYTTGTTWGNNLGVLTSTVPESGWKTVTGQTFGSTALASVPGWQVPGTQWAPGVYQYAGRFIMFYAAQVKGSVHRCLSVATSDTPRGPFTDRSTAPLICQPDGSIDAQPFIDADGRAWLHWKNNDEFSDTVSKVWAVPLGADGVTIVGDAIEVLAKDNRRFPWQTTVDNPQMVLVDGVYYLFHTGGDYQGNESYTVGYAICAGPVGPCNTVAEPILTKYGSVVGTGGGNVVRGDDGRWWISYHAWTSGCTSYSCGGKRRLYVSPLLFR